MPKTQFANGVIVTPEYLNSMFYTNGGHKHDGGTEDGHAPKINLETDVEGVADGAAMLIRNYSITMPFITEPLTDIASLYQVNAYNNDTGAFATYKMLRVRRFQCVYTSSLEGQTSAVVGHIPLASQLIPQDSVWTQAVIHNHASNPRVCLMSFGPDCMLRLENIPEDIQFTHLPHPTIVPMAPFMW